jgi:hypothetical protein
VNEEMLRWMNQRFPDGFICAEISDLSRLPVPEIVSLNTPILLHLPLSHLQKLIERFFEEGASGELICHVPGQNISATLGNIALKTRQLQQNDIYLVIADQ